jgi:drug/metabolite transporter (DMT)-like permease
VNEEARVPDRLIEQQGYKHMGKIYMLVSAFLTATGQLFWKWGLADYCWLAAGFACYGTGALFMIKSYAREKLSVAYPLMCTSYIFALIYGDLLLGEELTFRKVLAVAALGIGVTLTSYDK